MTSIASPTIERILFSKVSARAELFVRMLASGALGFIAWQDALYLPSLMAFALLIVYTRSAFVTWLSAFSYYLIASYELPLAFMNYYPEGYPVLGYVFWGLSAFLIAAPWALSRKFADLHYFNNIGDYRFAIASFLGMMISLLPPISWIHWVHPGLVAGMFFPGWGLTGLLLTFALISFFPLTVYKPQGKWPFILALTAFTVFFAYQMQAYTVSAFAPNVSAISTEDGKFRHSAGYERIKFVESVSEEAIEFQVPVVLFPEAYLGAERDSIHSILGLADGQMKANDVTILAGMETLVKPGVYDNALYGFGAESGVIYRARLPMPLNGLPFSDSRHRFHAFNSPVKQVSGKDYFFAICYEGYLLEHAIAAMLSSEQPEAMLASSNLWALKGLHLEKIQGLSILMMSRMMGIPLEWALNK